MPKELIKNLKLMGSKMVYLEHIDVADGIENLFIGHFGPLSCLTKEQAIV